MEDESNKVDSSLRHEKFLYEKKINEMERKKTDELNDLNQKYEKLQMEEAEQKDDNQQQMNKMEINHSQCKEELTELYEKKLEYEQGQFKQLKKDQELMRAQFEEEIKKLNEK